MSADTSSTDRKVLIDAKPKDLLPEWMRFMKGVVDSADIPLNISRETMQDSALIRKLGSVISKRVIKMFEKEAEADPEKLAKLKAQSLVSAPLALRGMLDCVNIGGECGIEEGLEYESAQFGLVFSTQDMREGTSAFLEKRKPAFAGR